MHFSRHFCLILLTPLLASALPATDGVTDAEIGNSVLQVAPLVVPGKDVAAHTPIARRQSNDPPAVQFSDFADDTPGKDKIPSNFVETATLDDKWSTPVCKILTAFKPEANGDARNFNYNVQGTHKKGMYYKGYTKEGSLRE
ncbi:hypothetical protein ONS95_012852 [Cadophora gregata]|uniref:uncharacterized protein n=1 Tax=Cadophora gregata TaxID=51156 RepID=UPI0026DC455A|nr:uncharacterized protein ONS95_012852 [Cadophora gregata]KAK0101168.1 hypothetical protein ONS96_006390 [Cadophora gregata f. sp. sojae]KAK0115801.1 hypothetical protein ONS95_012852 [Cadophora gregata]